MQSLFYGWVLNQQHTTMPMPLGCEPFSAFPPICLPLTTEILKGMAISSDFGIKCNLFTLSLHACIYTYIYTHMHTHTLRINIPGFQEVLSSVNHKAVVDKECTAMGVCDIPEENCVYGGSGVNVYLSPLGHLLHLKI